MVSLTEYNAGSVWKKYVRTYVFFLRIYITEEAKISGDVVDLTTELHALSSILQADTGKVL